MLQGNGYEAEQWVKERTAMVAGEVARSRGPATGVDVRTRFERTLALPQSLGRARAQVRAYWLPVAFTLGALIGMTLGG
jgi:hypothetical protein